MTRYIPRNGQKRSKWGNKKSKGQGLEFKTKSGVEVQVDGHLFDSRKEHKRFVELQLAQRGGYIKNLRCQVAIAIHVGGEKLCDYVADFVYYERIQHPDGGEEWVEIVEDSKGAKKTLTPEYRLKRKAIFLEYGIRIRET